MRNILKYAIVGIVAAWIGIQFVRPDRTNPPIDPVRDIAGQPYLPVNVQAVLERACFDCHSNRSRWPWYSQVAPASWLVAGDVHKAREHLNFSEWEGYRIGRRIAKLESLINALDKGEMPPTQYLLMHGDAELSESEVDLVTRWAEEQSDSLTAAYQRLEHDGPQQ